MRDATGNVQPSLDIYSNYPAPVVRNAPPRARESAMLQWGMLSPPAYMKALIAALLTSATPSRRTGGDG
jgi:putative SOS response-associated peptidase YedK